MFYQINVPRPSCLSPIQKASIHLGMLDCDDDDDDGIVLIPRAPNLIYIRLP